MELSLVPVLAIFLLFAASAVAFFVAKRTGIPHTVLLVATGVVLVVLAEWEPLAFFKDFTLTPELLFYIFLPTLLFESAFNINIRALTRDAIPVALLAIASLLVSALAVAAGLYWLLPLVGFPIPFSIAFIFGALISATDPVAVLALFKEYGAPRRLALLFEGESIFNDGTGYALFLIALEFALRGGFEVATVAEGALSFVIMLVGGAIFGLIIGFLFSAAAGWVRSSENVSITLMLVLAHVTFLLSEFISSHLHFGDFKVHLSAIVATAVAAVVAGNYGRTRLPLGAEEFVEKFWGQIAFFANSIVFILVGMFAISLPVSSPELFVPILIVVLIVAAGRALSIYPVVTFGWNRFVEKARSIPMAWQHLLAWGSLRGALAVTMALLIPIDLMVDGWEHDMTIQSVVLAFTTGCIFVTLFFKATTIGPMMRRLGLSRLSKIENAQYAESRTLIYTRVLERLDRFAQKGYVAPEIYERLRKYYADRLSETDPRQNGDKDVVADAVLRIWVLGIERDAAKELYAHNEISENAFKRIFAKLAARGDDAEGGVSSSEIHIRHYIDIFERIAQKFHALLGKKSIYDDPAESYMYYRALVIISHKVDKELARIEKEQGAGMFSPAIVMKTREIYARFAKDSRTKMQKVSDEHPEIAKTIAEKLARCGVLKVEEYVLHNLIEHQMITPKVFATLHNDFEHEAKRAN